MSSPMRRGEAVVRICVPTQDLFRGRDANSSMIKIVQTSLFKGKFTEPLVAKNIQQRMNKGMQCGSKATV